MVGGIALTVWQSADTNTDGQTSGQENVRTVTPQTVIKPTSLTSQSATPRAVCTFASIGLYWTPDGGAEDNPCRVHYRAAAEPTWREALPFWFDERIGEYRGSIAKLQSGTTYEVRLELADGATSAELKAAIWSETFPIARTVQVDDMTGTAWSAFRFMRTLAPRATSRSLPGIPVSMPECRFRISTMATKAKPPTWAPARPAPRPWSSA
jgi:hypothetical protein